MLKGKHCNLAWQESRSNYLGWGVSPQIQDLYNRYPGNQSHNQSGVVQGDERLVIGPVWGGTYPYLGPGIGIGYPYWGWGRPRQGWGHYPHYYRQNNWSVDNEVGKQTPNWPEKFSSVDPRQSQESFYNQAQSNERLFVGPVWGVYPNWGLGIGIGGYPYWGRPRPRRRRRYPYYYHR